MPRLAIFDLDNTLIAGDSDHLWGEFLVESKRVDATYYREANNQFLLDYQKGQLDITKYLKFALAPLAQIGTDELSELHKKFMQAKILPLMLPKAEDLINRHRKDGDTLLIITATNRFITEPIAKKLGVTNLLATTPERIEGKFTGEITGTPCFQEGKVSVLNEWLTRFPHDLKNACFYSDSINDVPLLEEVGNPVAVDPDPLLHKHATEKNWKIISLRR